MTHEEALNQILSHQCPVAVEEGEVKTFVFTICCGPSFSIKARKIEEDSGGNPKYEIISCGT